MSKLKLTMACWNYDRTRALQDGSVQPDGIDLNYLDLMVEETFFRMVRHQEFDVAEMSLSSYTVSLFREPRRFVAILRFTAAWMAGVAGMSWWKFFFWNASGGICWAAAVGLVAYYSGQAAADAINHYGLIGAGVVIGAGLLVALVVHRLKHRAAG